MIKCIDMTEEDKAIMQQIAVRRWSDDRRLHKRLVRLTMEQDCSDSAYFSLFVRKLLAPAYTRYRDPKDFT